MKRIRYAVAAPVIAVVISLLVAGIALAVSGHNPIDAFQAMGSYLKTADSVVAVINRAVPYYVMGLAVAIGFKMNLFNIGVDGQYRLAALLAAAAGAAVSFPPIIHIAFVIAVAMMVGASWAAIPGVLKVVRGVNEVVSTIMLNFIATGITAFLLANYLRDNSVKLVAQTKPLPESAWMPSLNTPLGWFGINLPKDTVLNGFLIIAIATGILIYLLIYRTRFGFDLRTSGRNPSAALSSGVNPKAMIMKTIMLSGAIAGLAGMAPLLGDYHQYGDTFPTALGFTGISVALLGRNHPAGIAVAAIVWAAIERGGQNLNSVGVPQEIAKIMQGTLLLSAVIAFEVVRRARLRAEVHDAAVKAHPRSSDPGEPLPALAGGGLV